MFRLAKGHEGAFAVRTTSGEIVDPGRTRRIAATAASRAGALLLLVCLSLTAALLPKAARAASVTVITSPDRADMPLDRNLLRALFTMRVRQWPDGQPARVFVFADSNPLHDEFCREILGTYPYVLRTAWDRLVFTGTGLAPTVVRSVAEMRQRVADTPGAIGYVPSGNKPDPATDSALHPDSIKVARHD